MHDRVKELPAFEKLHYKVDVLVCLDNIVESDLCTAPPKKPLKGTTNIRQLVFPDASQKVRSRKSKGGFEPNPGLNVRNRGN